MNPESLTFRKTDFMLVIGAILLLWGPGLRLSWGTRPLTLAPAAIAGPAIGRQSQSPCCLDRLPEPADASTRGGNRHELTVTVTGYSSSVSETDETPGLTATSSTARSGIIALSQDLLREFTPGAPFRFHDQVEIKGLGCFKVEDTMHPRWTRRADVWFPSRAAAVTWGRQHRELSRVPGDLAQITLLPGKSQVAATFGQANFQ